jgi:hypothetical protein
VLHSCSFTIECIFWPIQRVYCMYGVHSYTPHTHSVTHTHHALRRYGTHTADNMTHCTFRMFSRGLVSDICSAQKLPAIIWNQGALRTPPHIFLNKNNPDEAVCHCGDTFFAGFHLCNLKNMAAITAIYTSILK